jgi:hypothetical protein
MFSYHINIDIKKLLIKKLKYSNGDLKNTINCSEFQYANYTFVVSF